MVVGVLVVVTLVRRSTLVRGHKPAYNDSGGDDSSIADQKNTKNENGLTTSIHTFFVSRGVYSLGKYEYFCLDRNVDDTILMEALRGSVLCRLASLNPIPSLTLPLNLTAPSSLTRRFSSIVVSSMHPHTPVADCIEAGLPYDWDRIDIASDTEKEIVRALLEVTNSKAAASAAAAAAATSATVTPAAATTTAKAAEAAATRTSEGVHVENITPDDGRNTLASKPHGDPQVGTCGHCPTGAVGGTATAAVDGACNATMPVAPTEASAKRQRRQADSCASLGLGCVMTDGLSRANCSGRSQGRWVGGVGTGAGKCSGRSQEEGEGGGVGAGKVGMAVRDGAEKFEVNAATRWDSVGLREVKELTPGVEYWQIRMVLARFKSGWCGCPGSE